MHNYLKIDKHHIILAGVAIVALLYNILLYNNKHLIAYTAVGNFLSKNTYSKEHADTSSNAKYDDNNIEDEQTSLQSVVDIKNKRKRQDGYNNIIILNSGDTLYQILLDLGLGVSSAHSIVKSVDKVYKLTQMKIGQEIQIEAKTRQGDSEHIKSNPEVLLIKTQDQKITTTLDSGKQVYQTKLEVIPAVYNSDFVTGSVNSSFFHSAKARGLSVNTTMEFIKLFSYDVDFQRDVSVGSKFKVLYDYQVDKNNRKIKDGKILYASLNVKGKDIEIYRYKSKDGATEYLYRDGTNIKKALLKTPIKSAVITSGYGVRKHPILGYSRVHKGLDYAAPRGTPVLAAGDGVIEVVKHHNTYGNYIKIKHSNKRYATLYAHLDGFNKKIQMGIRVKQGEIIGYVGSSGMSTGPHLHYEVHIDGKLVNPSKVNMMPHTTTLAKNQLLAFKEQQSYVNQLMKRTTNASSNSFNM